MVCRDESRDRAMIELAHAAGRIEAALQAIVQSDPGSADDVAAHLALREAAERLASASTRYVDTVRPG